MPMKPTTLLVNPPLWNAYAPHLALPLLSAALRDRGWPVRVLDLSIESLDWLISSEGLVALEPKRQQRRRRVASGEEARRLERAEAVSRVTIERIDRAKGVLRSVDGLHDPPSFVAARTVLRNALWCVSAAFAGLSFDLFANDLYYSARSTAAVLAAVDDPERNVYRWVFERLFSAVVADPDVKLVAISVSADTQLVAAMTAAKLVRELRPDVHVVMGGNFATRMVTRWREPHPFFGLVDSFVLYEGEEALPALCERLFGDGCPDVPGLVEPRGEALHVQPSRPVPLDSIPSADFSGMPLERYFAPGPVLPTFASRSCLWKCAFCSIPFASNKFRARTGEQVLDDIEHQMARHGARYFMFVDEIMTIRSLHEVSDALIAREAGIFWYGETRFAPGLTSELARKLYRSGCRRLNLGLESYNQRVLDLMDKGTRIADVDRNVDALLDAGVPINLFAILGFPGETAEETAATVRFAEDVMRRSVAAGVPYSTWGASPFVLDVHSPVGIDPERHGVDVVAPPPHEDLALSLNYRVERGMSELDTRLLGSRLTVGRGGDAEAVWFHLERDVTGAEELIFLRACHQAGFPSPPRRTVQAWDLHDDVGVWLEPGVTVAEVRRPVLVRSGSGPRVVLYCAARDSIFELPVAAGDRFRMLAMRPATLSETVADLVLCGIGRDAAARQVEALVRNGFLATDARTVGPGDPDWCGVIFRPEPMVRGTFDERSRAAFLANPTTGRALRLNLSAYVHWLECVEGIVPSGRATGSIDLLMELAALGFSYPELASSSMSRNDAHLRRPAQAV
jgi:radical SAM superfamily enzyme YgiQ (UPF0313 family)